MSEDHSTRNVPPPLPTRELREAAIRTLEAKRAELLAEADEITRRIARLKVPGGSLY